jgi:NAD(P)-dependent dehydrogenase (short-subunit alcohol dehydrogenase family)
MAEISNKIAVTGSTRGTGAAVAERLANDGLTVIGRGDDLRPGLGSGGHVFPLKIDSYRVAACVHAQD